MKILISLFTLFISFGLFSNMSLTNKETEKTILLFEAGEAARGAVLKRLNVVKTKEGTIHSVEYMKLHVFSHSDVNPEVQKYTLVFEDPYHFTLKDNAFGSKDYKFSYEPNKYKKGSTERLFHARHGRRYIVAFDDKGRVKSLTNDTWGNASSKPVRRHYDLFYDSEDRINKVNEYEVFGKKKKLTEIRRELDAIHLFKHVYAENDFSIEFQDLNVSYDKKGNQRPPSGWIRNYDVKYSTENDFTIKMSQTTTSSKGTFLVIDKYKKGKIQQQNKEWTESSINKTVHANWELNEESRIVKYSSIEKDNEVLSERVEISYSYAQVPDRYDNEKMNLEQYFKQDIYNGENKLIEQRQSNKGRREFKNGVWTNWYSPRCGVR